MSRAKLGTSLISLFSTILPYNPFCDTYVLQCLNFESFANVFEKWKFKPYFAVAHCLTWNGKDEMWKWWWWACKNLLFFSFLHRSTFSNTFYKRAFCFMQIQIQQLLLHSSYHRVTRHKFSRLLGGVVNQQKEEKIAKITFFAQWSRVW